MRDQERNDQLNPLKNKFQWQKLIPGLPSQAATARHTGLISISIELENLMEYDIKDPKLAEGGRRRIQWAEREMPVLRSI